MEVVNNSRELVLAVLKRSMRLKSITKSTLQKKTEPTWKVPANRPAMHLKTLPEHMTLNWVVKMCISLVYMRIQSARGRRWATQQVIKTNKSVYLPDLFSDHQQRWVIKTMLHQCRVLVTFFQLRSGVIYLCKTVAFINDNSIFMCVCALVSLNMNFYSFSRWTAS